MQVRPPLEIQFDCRAHAKSLESIARDLQNAQTPEMITGLIGKLHLIMECMSGSALEWIAFNTMQKEAAERAKKS